MKKTTLILLASAFVTAPASAYTLYDNQEYGTKFDFVGSLRIKVSNETNKTTDIRENTVTKDQTNHPVQNNGTRFGFKLKQNIADGIYGIGRVEWRLRGKDKRGNETSSQHDFDHPYARQLYAGIGHEKYGELTYGNQTVITDEVKQTDLPNTLSLSDGLLASGARRSIQYAYTDKDKGFRAGAFYGGRSPRGNDGLSLDNERKNIWGMGVIKTYNIDEKQELTVALGTSRERFEQNNLPDYSRTAYSFGTAYTYDKTTIGLDLERRDIKDQDAKGNKRTNKEVRTVIYHKLTKDWRAYGMYAYKTEKRDYVSSSDRKEKQHQFMLGTEYYLIPKGQGPVSIKTFAEIQNTRTKNYRRNELRTKERNYTTVLGLRAYW